ncbi:sulfotransferase domain-containing protein [Ekhidna sp.]
MNSSLDGPNFLIIGAHKSATTSLHNLLSEIPDFFMTREKEPRYFALKDDDLDYRGPNDPASDCKFQTFDSYLSIFKEAKDTDLKGESSTLYLYDGRAAKNIHKFNPNIKIIAILRDPTKRAISNYNYGLMLGREKLRFDKALEREEDRIKSKWGPFWHYRSKGFYGKHLERYYELFPKENIKIIFYENFVKNQLKEVNEILEFLGRPESQVESVASQKSNRTLIPKNIVARLILSKRRYTLRPIPNWLRKTFLAKIVNGVLFTGPPEVSDEVKQSLRNGYKEDQKLLESLIGEKITCWN